MKYRKKPVEIEAIQWNGNNEIQIMEFVGKKLEFHTPPRQAEFDRDLNDSDYRIIIPTLEGNMIASRNDYIIKGIKGEFYPCKPDIFEATYDKI
ncbi:MAG: hypothetical protein JST04_01030 [Bdellovibrionales bacterium]|nr:hypothetical protein [Bdellovibrionales bacterium]